MTLKPILFNTPMVQAILDGRKTQTRRVLKMDDIPYDAQFGFDFFTDGRNKNEIACRGTFDDGYGERFVKMPILPCDILYVRETWGTWSPTLGTMPRIYYRADGNAPCDIKWKPSIHMPKEAVRIFLRVTNVRVERLQDITTDGANREGAENAEWDELQEEASAVGLMTYPLREFFGYNIWDRTLQGEENYKKYGWDANPWVWVFTFERTTESAT